MWGAIAISLGLLSLFGVTGIAQVKIEKVPIKSVSPAQGKEMFMEYCAVCHGSEGRGNGPAAAALTKAPADLTQLAVHNSGKFPDVRVSRFIEGQDTVLAHGTRDMPVWGALFRGATADTATTTMRVANLTDYVKSIQAR